MDDASTNRRPGVVSWYIVYCLFLAVVYLLVAGAGYVMLTLDPAKLVELGELSPEEAQKVHLGLGGTVLVGLGALLALTYAAAPFLPRRPWAWVYGIVVMGLGSTSICLIPAAVPLLIYWIKPEVQRYFGRSQADVQAFR